MTIVKGQGIRVTHRRAERVGILALLREVFQAPSPKPTLEVSLLKTYRRTVEDILADTTVLGPTGCLEYNHHGFTNGQINSVTGYGKVIFHGKQWPVHRLIGLYTHVKHPRWRAWLAAQRWIHVCHTCDNPPCINPDHLVIAPAQYNTWDSIMKGRRSGSSQTVARLRILMQQEAEAAVREAEQLVIG